MIVADTNHEPADNNTVRQSAANVIEDVVVLAELHWQLFLDDTQKCASQIVPVAEAVAVGAVLLFAAIGLGLVAIALKLVSAGISPAGSFGLVALATFVAAAALLAWSRKRLGRMSEAFVRSRTEFAKNIAWIKTRL